MFSNKTNNKLSLKQQSDVSGSMIKLEEQFIRNSKIGGINYQNTLLTSSTIDVDNFNMHLTFVTAQNEAPIEEDKSYTIDDAFVAAGGFGKSFYNINAFIR